MPWHDAQVIAHARAITGKRKLGWEMKSPPKGKAVWADVAHAKLYIACPEFMLTDLKESILNCYAFIFKKNLNFSYVLLLDIFSIIKQFFLSRKNILMP